MVVTRPCNYSCEYLNWQFKIHIRLVTSSIMETDLYIYHTDTITNNHGFLYLKCTFKMENNWEQLWQINCLHLQFSHTADFSASLLFVHGCEQVNQSEVHERTTCWHTTSNIILFIAEKLQVYKHASLTGLAYLISSPLDN